MNTIVSFINTFLFFIAVRQGDLYGESWDGASAPDQGNVIMQAMASNDLIFVVLGVSLIIWFVLITYLIRLEKKLEKLEKDHLN